MATAFPWRLVGGAARPDAITGMTPDMQAALIAFYQAAPPEVQRELALNSAYRSPQRQKELWDASDKSGRMVAAPGKSHHNIGDAVDLYGFGLGGKKLDLVSQQARDWVKANAAAHGFYFPMDYEPWHMQYRGQQGSDVAQNSAQGVAIPAAGGQGFRGPPQQGPAMPKERRDYTPEQRRAAIASIESAGSGDYGARGPVVNRQGDQALGRYQIMASNLPAWSKEVLGREVSVDEFMRDPKLQDAIFDKKFGDFVAKHGEEGAASMWFTGRPDAPDVKDPLGTTSRGYITKYLNALGEPLKVGEPYPVQQENIPAPAGGGGTAVAGAPPAATAAPKDPLAGSIADLAGSLGTMAGGTGASKQMPIARAAAPVSTPVFAQPTSIADPTMVDAQRQRLAMALSRLNSGKLWT